MRISEDVLYGLSATVMIYGLHNNIDLDAKIGKLVSDGKNIGYRYIDENVKGNEDQGL